MPQLYPIPAVTDGQKKNLDMGPYKAERSLKESQIRKCQSEECQPVKRNAGADSFKLALVR